MASFLDPGGIIRQEQVSWIGTGYNGRAVGDRGGGGGEERVWYSLPGHVLRSPSWNFHLPYKALCHIILAFQAIFRFKIRSCCQESIADSRAKTSTAILDYGAAGKM